MKTATIYGAPDCDMCAIVAGHLQDIGYLVEHEPAADAVEDVRRKINEQGGALPVVAIGGRIFSGREVMGMEESE